MLQPTPHLRANCSTLEQLWMSSDGGEGEWRPLNRVDIPRKVGHPLPASREDLMHGPTHFLDK